MWIICLADDSHEMSSFIFSEKKKKKKRNEKNRMSSGIFLLTQVLILRTLIRKLPDDKFFATFFLFYQENRAWHFMWIISFESQKN